MQTDVTENNVPKTSESEKQNELPESPAGTEHNAKQNAEQNVEQKSEQENANAADQKRIEELSEKLSDTEIRLHLLLAGVAKEKLSEGAELARGICKAGKTPEEAAREIAEAYPHLRSVRREVPKFSASGSGDGDGFAAIRSIFAKR